MVKTGGMILYNKEKDLSLLIQEAKERIKHIKECGNAFVTDWLLIEILETIIEKIEKE
tara:strand:- start:2459 stop:2632 length:174 start_codon:yes stop_codon:yes gene_type:complete